MTEDHNHGCACGHEHDHAAHAADKFQEAFARFSAPLTDAEVNAAVERLLAEKKAQYDTPQGMRDILAACEFTTLKETDSDESVLAMVERVNAFYNDHPDVPPMATICTYPRFAKLVSQSLEVEGIRPIVVTGAFPSSQTFLEIKTVETALAVRDGAAEVDCVLSVGQFLSGDYETCADEIAEIKASAGDAPLKVILESGSLQTSENIHKASILSIYAGADFLKTSTGKTSVAATPQAAYVMCRVIKEYYALTGTKIGFKAAGGMTTVSDTLDYYTIVKELLGDEWIKEELFRLGTSRCANLVVSRVVGEDIEPF